MKMNNFAREDYKDYPASNFASTKLTSIEKVRLDRGMMKTS